MSIVRILTYKNNKNPEVISKEEAIKAIESKQDLNLHLKIDATEPCILFGDIDYCKSKDELNNLFNLIEEHLDVDGDEMKFTINEKEDGTFTSHWTFPKLKTTIPYLKKIFTDKKFEKYKKQIDTSVYRNGLFRLPYQTTKEKTTVHKIYCNTGKKAGKKDDTKLGAKDFIINRISKKAKEYKFYNNDEKKYVEYDSPSDCDAVSEEKPKQIQKTENKTQEETMKEIKKMALKLNEIGYFDSFDIWIKLGMIIFHETSGDIDGLELFNELSENISNYKGKSDVAKQYYSLKPRSKPLTIKSLYMWFYEKYPEEKPKVKNNEYDNYKQEFEEKVFKLDNPVAFGIENSEGLQLVSLNNLIIWGKGKCPTIKTKIKQKDGCEVETQADFITLWINDFNNRTLDSIIFNPKMPNTNDYNLYKGSVYHQGQPAPDDNIFLKLLKFISNDDTAFEYLKQWISHIVKTPWKKTNCAIILYSEIGGVGKNAITDALCKLFKNYSAHIESIEDLTKNFNSHLTNKLFIYGDEINANAKKISDKLKQIITRPKQNLEKKGIDSISLDDYSNYMFTTNNENCFKLDKEDRRYMMVRAPNVPLEKEFYDEFYQYINNEDNMNQLYNYFLNYDKNDFNVGTGRAPQTQYKKEIIFENENAYTQFVYKNATMLAGCCYSSNELNQQATEYAKKNYLSTNWTTTRFGIEMKKLLAPYVKRNNGTKFDLRNVNRRELNKHLYNHNKDYYKYINDIDEEPSFDSNGDDTDDDDDDEAGGQF